jgi:hypothetical protein
MIPIIIFTPTNNGQNIVSSISLLFTMNESIQKSLM